MVLTLARLSTAVVFPPQAVAAADYSQGASTLSAVTTFC